MIRSSNDWKPIVVNDDWSCLPIDGFKVCSIEQFGYRTILAMSSTSRAQSSKDEVALQRLADLTCTPFRLQRLAGRRHHLMAHRALLFVVGAAFDWVTAEDEITINNRRSGAPVVLSPDDFRVRVSVAHERGFVSAAGIIVAEYDSTAIELDT